MSQTSFVPDDKILNPKLLIIELFVHALLISARAANHALASPPANIFLSSRVTQQPIDGYSWLNVRRVFSLISADVSAI